MSQIILKSNSEEYQCHLELEKETQTFKFEFTYKEKTLRGRGTWLFNSEGFILNFLMLEVFYAEGRWHPENSIPYTGRQFTKNSYDNSYTLEGYFNPENLKLVLFEN